MNLEEIIKLIKEHEQVRNVYFHRNYENGTLELNIEFKDNAVMQKIADKELIEEIDSCAFWE